VVLHEPRVVITNFIAYDVPKEIKRLGAAVETMRSDLDVLLERGEVAEGGEHRDVLEAYRMFAYDRGWVHRLEEAVATGLTANACAGGSSRKAVPTRTLPSLRAPSASPRSARSPMPLVSPIRAMPSLSMDRLATCMSAPPRTWRRPISSGCGCGRDVSCNISP